MGRRLSQQDAFFVAYQETSGAAMSLGFECEIDGELSAGTLEALMDRLVERWPRLGQPVERRLFGLAWQERGRRAAMVSEAREHGDFERWRGGAIDVFHEPPFQLLWSARGSTLKLAFRAHHAALDGHSLATVGADALRLLIGGESSGASTGTRPGRRASERLRAHHLLQMWRHLRFLQRESRRDDRARLLLRSSAPGGTAICSRELSDSQRGRLELRSRATGLGSPWLAAAAWCQALGGFNADRGRDEPAISLELPVSTRRRQSGNHAERGSEQELGNGISTLVLSAEWKRPLEQIARALRRQFTDGVRRRYHLAVPFFTAAAKYSPWRLFRRLAADTTYSGFATSHFTWMRSSLDPGELGRLSGGRLELRSFELYGPVCLHMGAALLGFETPTSCRLSITYRTTALARAEAEELASRVHRALGFGGSDD